MRVYKGETFADVYRDSLDELLNLPDFESSPRGLKCKEILNTTLVIDNPILSTYNNNRRGSQYKYIAAEFLWYFLGRNDVEFIKKYAKFWESIQNPDGTVNSAYGNLIFKPSVEELISQYDWAISSLIKDKDTRQAVMHFNLPKHQHHDNKDFVCTMYSNFHIRDNKLHFSVKMRSNDAILGTPTDIAFFTMLHQQAYLHLKTIHSGLKIGSYSHTVDSFHIYERHFNLVNEMLDDAFYPESIGILKDSFIEVTGEPTNKLKGLYNHIIDPTRRFESDCDVYNFVLNKI